MKSFESKLGLIPSFYIPSAICIECNTQLYLLVRDAVNQQVRIPICEGARDEIFKV